METKKLSDNMLTTATGGTTSSLKGRFSAGSIPLDTDFSELIDIAECGRRAIGQSADQTDNTPGAGLTLDTSTATATMGKLSVLAKPGSGITVDGTGVGIDQSVLFPKGMIMMYFDNGTHTAPTGWAICDGSNGTPDLRSKFVMGGEWSGETNDKSMSGSKDSRYASGTALGGKASINENATDSHMLTTNEMPSHTHEISGRQYPDKHYVYWSDRTVGWGEHNITDAYAGGKDEDQPGHDNYKDYDLIVAANSGGGAGHSHSITQSDHTHNVQVEIPYYTLMYIMKL